MNRWTVVAIAATVTLALVAALACGQTTDDPTSTPVSDSRPGGIEGIVTDPEGRPVAGMRVGIISGTVSFPEPGPETDDEGHYELGGIPPGTFEVAVHDRDGERVGLEKVVVKSGETATLDFSVSAAAKTQPASVASPISIKEPTDGLCLPAVPLAVSVGDTWTISGPVRLPEGFPTELPVGAAGVSSTFVVIAIGSTQYVAGRGAAPIEHPTIQLRVTNVTRGADGNILSTEDGPRAARGGWTPASVTNLGPALTPDWECHEKAWLGGWPPVAQTSVGEKVLSSGVTAVVFSVTQPFILPGQGIDATIERHHGYDKLTGRVVLQEVRTTGTRNGAPFDMEMLQELMPAGANVPASRTGPGDCEEELELRVSSDEGRTEERAVVTSYQCMTIHVDSTGQQPSRSSSLLVSRGVPLSFRLASELQPSTLDIRLYPGAGVSGYFFRWPEELPPAVAPVDRLQPAPSPTFQYLPQQPPGQYSLVIRATWDGPIVVFYAIGFTLE